ncbi:c-type cytochrome [Fulvivirga lutimaris]|uniref:c-type cytochrome n=1 Tax=Fulvivirga lutimaris TaxID=1819566 RepID=UPI0012BB9B31|nr:c-type cytochrome [Fulvivirga lutimaris]MTI41124.1 c-type cytochrome [Fulvivirga lutimaris]
MKNLVYYITLTGISFLLACNVPPPENNQDDQIESDTTTKGNVTYIDTSDPLDVALITEGKIIFEKRCDNCHRSDSIKLVGPGWAGITNRRSPEWIMNMILNVGIMVEHDSVAHKLLEENEVKMPDQHLAVDKARAVLEFMRANDLKTVGSKDEADTKN